MSSPSLKLNMALPSSIIHSANVKIVNKKATRRRYKKHNPLYFLECAAAGAISCSFAHSAMIPLDVIKTKIQINAELTAMKAVDAMRYIVKREGIRVLFQGIHRNIYYHSIVYL